MPQDNQLRANGRLSETVQCSSVHSGQDSTYADLAAWMTGIGYGTTPDDVKNAKRTLAAKTDWSLVKDAKVRKLLEAIATRYNWPKV